MKILVTGGAGFIGRHLVEELVRRGECVAVLDIATLSSSLPAGIEYHQGTVLDETLVAQLIGESDRVVHLAGIAEPALYGSDPLGTMNVNLFGAINVVRQCTDLGVPIVFSSTSEVYGINPDVPWREDADRVLGPTANVRWCYSTSKAAVEHYLDASRRQLGLEYTTIRLFNTYGSGLAGRVIDTFIRQALLGEPLVVHGAGEQTRCFCHIEDVTQALARLVLADALIQKTYNVGNETETTITDLAVLIVELAGSDSSVLYKPYSTLYDGFQDVPRRKPNTSALQEDLGWAPRIDLREGLSRLIEVTARNMQADRGYLQERLC